MEYWAIFLLLVVIIIVLLYLRYLQKVRYWKRLGVENIDLWELYQRSKVLPSGINLNKYYRQMYNEKKPFMVIECLLDSMLFVQDLEAIKEIMITQFENFPDRGFYVNHREALSVNLSRLEYDMWKPVRHKLTPSFSPAKVRNMFPILLEVTQKLIKVLAEDSQRALDNQIEILDLCSRFTIDIIGNVAFGIECNSLENPQTEFLLQGNRAFLGILNPFWDMFGNKYPKILQFLNVYVFSRESNAFFKRVFQETKAFREKNNVRRNDFMDLLLELKLEQGEDKDFPLTSDLLVGQLFAFFIAGFETNACTLTYALYELAKHPDIQEKARQEVMQLKAANNQKLTYDSMKQLKFLKAIVQETLRKYPIGSVMPRVCVRQCTIKTSYNTTLTIQPGTFVLIPFYGVHHNPDYYPEPEKFLPQRFCEENETNNSDSCKFLAFGIGPKVCIGELFARLELHLALASLLTEFRFSVCNRTPDELRFDPKKRFTLYLKDGLFLKVNKLN